MSGFGPIRIGMTVQQAAAASGWQLVADPTQESDECWYASVTEMRGVRVMVEHGRVSRIDIDNASYSTLSGIRVGDTEEHAKDVYGAALEVLRDKYDANGHNLVLRSRDGKFAMVLETDGRLVTQMHAGREPSAEYVEGCL